MSSPRDRFLTIVGRKPVIEALDDGVDVAQVFIAESAGGDSLAAVLGAAARRKIPVERVSEHRVTQLAGSPRHHQGVVADASAPNMAMLADFLERRRSGRDWATNLFLLDHVHNPSNVGMILRAATAAGIDGVIVPRRGTADIGAVAIKASAGVAFKAPILRCASTEEALVLLEDARFTFVGLVMEGAPLFDAELPDRAVYILGNETDGLSTAATAAIDMPVSLPLRNDVESLNVASAASVLAYEVLRRLT